MSTPVSAASALTGGELQAQHRQVILASSLGTVFEWYDFYIYGTLAAFFAGLFFPPGNPVTALLTSLLTFGVGFVVRPFGALVFGRIGDLVGRKYTFLITITVMGLSTALVGVLPTFATIGWAAPIILFFLRVTQGLALGGEYGGAATYVGEHAPQGKRGFYTSWIQTTATLGLFLALAVILILRRCMSVDDFKSLGLANPFSPVNHSPRDFRLYPAETSRVARLRGDEIAGQRIDGSFAGQFSQDAECQVCLAGSFRRNRRPRGRLVYRTIPCLVLPSERPKP